MTKLACESVLQGVLLSSADGWLQVRQLGQDLSIIAASDALCCLMGYTEKEFLNYKLVDYLIVDQEYKQLIESCTQAKPGHQWRCNVIWQCAEGRRMWCRLHVTALEKAGERTFAILVVNLNENLSEFSIVDVRDNQIVHFALNAQGQLDTVWASLNNLLQCSSDVLQGEGWLQIIEDVDRERVQQQWRQYKRSGVLLPFEVEYGVKVAAVLSRFWLVIRPNVVKNKLIGYDAQLSDHIYMPLQKMCEFEKVNTQLQLLKSLNVIGSYRLDINGQLLEMDVGLSEIVGHPYESIKDRGWIDTVYHEDRERLVKEVATYLAAPDPNQRKDFYCRVITGKGEIRYVRTSNLPIVHAEAIIGFYGVMVDVTLAYQIEQENIKVSQEREAFKRIIDETAYMIAYMNPSTGQSLYTNAAFQTNFDGMTPSEVHTQAEWKRLSKEVFPVLEAEGVWFGEIEFINQYGATMIVHCSCAKHKGVDEEPVFSITGHDVTHIKQQEQILAHYRGRFAAAARVNASNIVVSGIAHQINQPLMALSTSLQLLHTKLSNLEGQELSDCSEKIHQAIQQCAQIGSIIHRLNGLLRRQNTQYRPVCIWKHVRSLCTEISSQYPSIIFNMVCDIQYQHLIFMVDLIMVQQILDIFIRNSIDSVQALGDQTDQIISVRQEIIKNQLVFCVQDNGGGVPLHLRDDIFETFFTTKAGGTGIGLPLAQMMAEACDGKIVCQHPDQGVEFILQLPLLVLPVSCNRVCENRGLCPVAQA